jgi:hypothetical protein
MPHPEVSLVIPIYNEDEVLPRLDERLRELLDKIGTSVAASVHSARGVEGAAATAVYKEERQGLRT